MAWVPATARLLCAFLKLLNTQMAGDQLLYSKWMLDYYRTDGQNCVCTYEFTIWVKIYNLG